MDIIFFGNRNYWNIKKAGHTRYEQIFKKLISIGKHNIIYCRIFNPKHLIKHLKFYFTNYKKSKIKISNNTLFVFTYLNENLTILSIYRFDTKNVISNNIGTIEDYLTMKSSLKMIWFNNYLIWNDLRGANDYKYYFDSFEIFHSPNTGNLKYSDDSMNLYSEIVNNVSLITSISDEGVRFFKKINSNSKVYLVRNGVDLDIFKPYPKSKETTEKVVGMIGNIHKYHDYSGLLKAASDLKHVRFIIAGKISNSKELLDEETSKNINSFLKLPNVKHYKWVPVNDLPSLINTFDVGLITYKTKMHDRNSLLGTGDSLKKYQYLACNVPVISSDCQKVDIELRDGIFNYFKEEDLKSLIENVLYNEKNTNYRKLVKNYDWGIILDKILNYACLN